MIISCLAAICLTGAVAIDGDTMRIDSQGENLRFRLWGIDAPEVATAQGVRASRALAHLITGQTVSCALMDIDRYGRPVVRCATTSVPDIACEMVRLGHAVDWPKYSGGAYSECAPR